MYESLSNISAADWIEFAYDLSPIFWLVVGIVVGIAIVNIINQFKRS